MSFKQPATALYDFLRESYSKGPFAAFYEGDPGLIANSNLPCLVVEKLRDQSTAGPTGFQRVTETLRVKVVMNKQDDWTGQHELVDTTEKKIRDIVEDRDPETGRYLPNTLKHALIHRFEVNGQGINDDMTFELGVDLRPEDTITEEGHLTISVTHLVANPQRNT
ncbi:hypothetical protein AB0H71_28880 [Nocardia sp. NPDC050697]|uniref:hypothetical protein n=1 Tax=Nocardia sp. NPDC050697 TaxID=3155158 RepID=UPI0033D7F461